MIKEKLRILRFNLKGNYMVVEELWRFSAEDKPCKIQVAYTCDKRDYIGNPRDAKYLAKRGITNFEKISPDHCVVSIGFNPKEKKWYGWSHRAIFAFGIGSKVKKGDCAYRPSSPQEIFEEVTKVEKYEDGWEFQWLKPENITLTGDGIRVREEMVTPIFKDGVCTGYEPAPPHFWEIKCGRGEWEAKTLEDAKQMAIDFANSVS